MPRKHKHLSDHALAEHMIIMDKLDRKIEATKVQYDTSLHASFAIRAIQSFLALLVPIIAFIPSSEIMWPVAILGAIVGAMNGIDLKKQYTKDAGKYKAHYDSLVRERYEYIKKEGAYYLMPYSMRIRQISWRTEHINAVSSPPMITPASSSEELDHQMNPVMPNLSQV